jgi:hypothetical protein
MACQWGKLDMACQWGIENSKDFAVMPASYSDTSKWEFSHSHGISLNSNAWM